ncbi:MAG: YgjP-like metallopeptidase domain-containing protein [Candidatus Magasanikbacteria bacterium]
MNKTITLKNKELAYSHRRLRRSRRVRLAISFGGKITVTTPIFFPEYKIKDFLFQHADWILEKIANYKEKESKSIFPVGHKDYLINKSRALRLVREKLAQLNGIYNFRYNKVTVKNTNSRWGSCSKSGNLNFNYKLIYLPDDLAGYVVAHELSHLQEMNHGRNFWKLVSKTVPHWQILRKQLKNIY